MAPKREVAIDRKRRVNIETEYLKYSDILQSHHNYQHDVDTHKYLQQ